MSADVNITVKCVAELSVVNEVDKVRPQLAELHRQFDENNIDKTQYEVGLEIIMEAFAELNMTVGETKDVSLDFDGDERYQYAADHDLAICDSCKALKWKRKHNKCFVCRGDN